MNAVQFQSRLHQCWLLAKASYHKDSAGYLARHDCDASQLATAKIRGWKMVLLQAGTGELCVGFRGSRTKSVWKMLQDKLRNIGIHIRRPRLTLHRMEEQLEAWQKKYGEIRLLTGHSEGGYFATHLWRNVEGVWHVTFNGHKAKRGSHHINLRTKSDLVSKVLGVADRYFTVGKGKHGLKSFQKYLTKSKHIGVWQKFFDSSDRVKLLARLSSDPLWTA